MRFNSDASILIMVYTYAEISYKLNKLVCLLFKKSIFFIHILFDDTVFICETAAKRFTLLCYILVFISDEGHHSAFSMLYASQRWKCRGHGEFLYSAYF